MYIGAFRHVSVVMSSDQPRYDEGGHESKTSMASTAPVETLTASGCDVDQEHQVEQASDGEDVVGGTKELPTVIQMTCRGIVESVRT